MTDPTTLLTRLLALAELAVDAALELDYGDPEDRYIYRELQELKPLVAEALARPESDASALDLDAALKRIAEIAHASKTLKPPNYLPR